MDKCTVDANRTPAVTSLLQEAFCVSRSNCEAKLKDECKSCLFYKDNRGAFSSWFNEHFKNGIEVQ